MRTFCPTSFFKRFGVNLQRDHFELLLSALHDVFAEDLRTQRLGPHFTCFAVSTGRLRVDVLDQTVKREHGHLLLLWQSIKFINDAASLFQEIVNSHRDDLALIQANHSAQLLHLIGQLERNPGADVFRDLVRRLRIGFKQLVDDVSRKVRSRGMQLLEFQGVKNQCFA